jgi:hypothetical protein
MDYIRGVTADFMEHEYGIGTKATRFCSNSSLFAGK